YKEGDQITAVDGHGGWYKGTITRIIKKSVWVEISSKERRKPVQPRIVTAIGLIKKKDRLEFAVEKAVELGAAEIAIFRCENSVKQNVRTGRLEKIALSAMKQSLLARLAKIKFFNSLLELLQYYSDSIILAAHQSCSTLKNLEKFSEKKDFLLITGPEGDFSEHDMKLFHKRNVKHIALGKNRYRTETASVIFLNSFLLLFT